MKREYQDYLNDLIEAMDKIEQFTANLTIETFEKDEKTILPLSGRWKSWEKLPRKSLLV
jgi:uncharacterized protein with HEPN domain